MNAIDRDAYRNYALEYIQSKVSYLSSLKDGCDRTRSGYKAMCACGWAVAHGFITDSEFTGLFQEAYSSNGLLRDRGQQSFHTTVTKALTASKSDELPKIRKNLNGYKRNGSQLASKKVPTAKLEKPQDKLFYDAGIIRKGFSLVDVYPYHDEDGEVVYEKLKYVHADGKKQFLYRHYKEDGQAYNGRGQSKEFPYNMIDLFDNDQDHVIVCEGEKDANNAKRLGLLAVSVNNWADSIEYFKGRSVVIVPDNDIAGRDKAANAIGKLKGVASKVTVLDLPDLPEKGDFTDWLNSGGTLQQFKDLLQEKQKQDSERIMNESLVQERPEEIRAAIDYETDKKGRKVNTRPNLALAIERLGVSLRYNELTDTIEMNGLQGFNGSVSDAALRRLYFDVKEKEGFNIVAKLFNEIIFDIAVSDSYHPIKDYILSIKWDGKPRVKRFFIDVAGANDTALNQRVTEIWFTAAVRRLFNPGCDFQELVVLKGPQGGGKTTALRKLCVNMDWYSDDLPLDAEAKKVMELTRGKWIIEAGELAGRKTDIESLKRFLSATTDRARLSYARVASDIPRQWVTIGTTNENEFLIDSTGNRRFWPIDVNIFNHDILTEDYVSQLWAEAVQLHLQGVSIKLEPELWQAAAEVQNDCFSADPWEEGIVALLPEGDCAIAVASILPALHVEQKFQDRRASGRVGHIMKRLGFEKKPVRDDSKKLVKCWVRGEGGSVRNLSSFGQF